MRVERDQPAEYRTTLFDRHGPAAADRLRAGAYGAMTSVLVVSVSLLVVHRVSVGTFVAAALAGLIPYVLGQLMASGAGNVMNHVMAGGSSTPYEEQFSYQEALVVRGQVEDALASFEAVIRERPGAVAPRLRAAALYASRGDNPRRAAELLREVQRTSGLSARDDILATNRLVELLMGPLGEPGRAMVELRRLMDRHPDTDAAARAKLVLAELKQQIV